MDNPAVVRRPLLEETPRISAYKLYFQKLQLLAYIFAADSIWVYLHSLSNEVHAQTEDDFLKQETWELWSTIKWHVLYGQRCITKVLDYDFHHTKEG